MEGLLGIQRQRRKFNTKSCPCSLLTRLQYECCSYIIDTWIDTVAQGRSNIAPAKIPWEMITTLITEMYGGKIDNESDWQTLAAIVRDCMTPAAFEDNFKIVKDTDVSEGLELPSTTGWKDFMQWVNDLPERRRWWGI